METWSRLDGFANGDIASFKGSVLTFSLSLESFLSPFTRTILRLLTFEAYNRVSALFMIPFTLIGIYSST